MFFFVKVKQALDAGHQVRALVRTPSKMSSLTHDSLEVVEADVLSSESLLPHFKDVDAVISTLGFSMRPKPVS